MQLSSPDFIHNEPMPVDCGIEGAGLSPTLAWSDLPAGTRTLALFMVDADVPAPMGPFTHWCIYNLPVSQNGLPGGVTQEQIGGLGAVEARNGAGKRGYYPPCPVNGAHSYTFELLALRTDGLKVRSDRWSAVRKALDPYVLDSARLTGLYRCNRLSDRQAFWLNMRMMIGLR